MNAMRVGIVGVGLISDTFIKNIKENFKNLELVGCTARNMDHIKKKAEQYNILPMTIEEMLNDKSIEMIVNLTPVESHYEIIKRALEAGKHVYTEKVMTEHYKEAKELSELADAKGLYLGCAPDTFLGSAIQTATEAIAEGVIGEITGFSIMLNRDLEMLYEIMGFLLQPGAGIGYDFGVYALTAVLSILGPVADVGGFLKTNRPVRTYKLSENTNFGKQYEIKNENVMAAVMNLKNGVLGSVMFNGDSIFPAKPYICIQGTKGLLNLSDPNQFGGDIWLTKAIDHPSKVKGNKEPSIQLGVHHNYSINSRGIGAAEMVTAIREKRANRASKEMATHILELLDGIAESCKTKRFYIMGSSFDIPPRLNGSEVF